MNDDCGLCAPETIVVTRDEMNGYLWLLEGALVGLLDDYVARDGFVVTHDAIDDILRAVMGDGGERG